MTWFTLGRKDGGPSSYEGINKYFQSKKVKIIVLTSALIVPLIAIVIILVLLYRKKRIIPTVKIIVCMFTGISLLLVTFVNEWTKISGNLIIHNGPVRTPTKLKIGIKSGLYKIVIYMECPGAPIPEYFEENINLGNRKILHSQYLSALRDGWAWPLLFMLSLLGGETLAWDNSLGECLYRASQVSEPCIIASVYLWFLWCISYKIAPSKKFHMMILFGVTLLLGASMFFAVIFSCSKIRLPDGQELSIEIDWCAGLTAGLGLCFSIVGFGGIFIREKEVTISKYDQMVIKDSRSSIGSDTRVYAYPTSQLNGKLENTTDNEIQNPNTYIDCNGKPLSPTNLSNMFVQ